MKTFIEIGTCDFDTCQRLADNGWQGIMLEPNPQAFKNMNRVMEGYDNVITLQYAVSDYEGMIELGVSKQDYPDKMVRGMSSIVADNHKGGKVFEYNNKSKTYLDKVIKVPCTRLDTLIYENGITNIDFLKIDVEGHEMNIIEDYTWDVKPTFIKMEHKHIDDIKAVDILQAQGYLTWTEREDIYAVR
tara:strand:- start:248 stop:811 length:564 start_codon:yes stop_codon:yes gene_type:complete